MKSLKIKYNKTGEITLELHCDPIHRDIVLNGYGITRKEAKKIRDWLTSAIRKTKRKNK